MSTEPEKKLPEKAETAPEVPKAKGKKNKKEKEKKKRVRLRYKVCR